MAQLPKETAVSATRTVEIVQKIGEITVLDDGRNNEEFVEIAAMRTIVEHDSPGVYEFTVPMYGYEFDHHYRIEITRVPEAS